MIKIDENVTKEIMSLFSNKRCWNRKQCRSSDVYFRVIGRKIKYYCRKCGAEKEVGF